MLAKLKNKAIKALGGFTQAELHARVYDAERAILNKVVTDEFLRVCKWHLNKQWLERVAAQVSDAMREAQVSVFHTGANPVGRRQDMTVNTIRIEIVPLRWSFNYVTFGEEDNP